MNLFFSLFGKNEPGAVGTPRYGGPPAWLARNVISAKRNEKVNEQEDPWLSAKMSQFVLERCAPREMRTPRRVVAPRCALQVGQLFEKEMA